jgi:hypothetical protein
MQTVERCGSERERRRGGLALTGARARSKKIPGCNGDPFAGAGRIEMVGPPSPQP